MFLEGEHLLYKAEVLLYNGPYIADIQFDCKILPTAVEIKVSLSFLMKMLSAEPINTNSHHCP